MSFEIEVTDNGCQVFFYLQGEFGSEIKDQVQEMVRRHGAGATYHFDFANVSRVLSSGVGMLMMLRQELGGMIANIKLVNCSTSTRATFNYVGIQNLFFISRQQLNAA